MPGIQRKFLRGKGVSSCKPSKEIVETFWKRLKKFSLMKS